jgi:hypothetical protein
MASKQDLAEQLLRRADTDAAGARAMLPINEVADVYAAGLRYDDDTVHAVERETASRWATAAVQWARGLVEEAGGGQKPSTEPEAVDGG